MVDKLEVLNASFLFVNSTEYSFSKNDWIEAVKLHVQEAQEIASVLFSILRSNSLIEQVSENVYT
ncbi:hypothetical protein, partial [Exiguobacterium indicum]|uniref:hypothetical protein n=1 Tax=Exiguobacterium indicum TaxID=296995 RepID=UPI0019D3F55F